MTIGQPNSALRAAAGPRRAVAIRADWTPGRPECSRTRRRGRRSRRPFGPPRPCRLALQGYPRCIFRCSSPRMGRFDCSPGRSEASPGCRSVPCRAPDGVIEGTGTRSATAAPSGARFSCDHPQGLLRYALGYSRHAPSGAKRDSKLVLGSDVVLARSHRPSGTETTSAASLSRGWKNPDADLPCFGLLCVSAYRVVCNVENADRRGSATREKTLYEQTQTRTIPISGRIVPGPSAQSLERRPSHEGNRRNRSD
jgi:hypothetical protein